MLFQHIFGRLLLCCFIESLLQLLQQLAEQVCVVPSRKALQQATVSPRHLAATPLHLAQQYPSLTLSRCCQIASAPLSCSWYPCCQVVEVLQDLAQVLYAFSKDFHYKQSVITPSCLGVFFVTALDILSSVPLSLVLTKSLYFYRK